MAALEPTLLHLSSSKIEELSKEIFKVATRFEELLNKDNVYKRENLASIAIVG